MDAPPNSISPSALTGATGKTSTYHACIVSKAKVVRGESTWQITLFVCRSFSKAPNFVLSGLEDRERDLLVPIYPVHPPPAAYPPVPPGFGEMPLQLWPGVARDRLSWAIANPVTIFVHAGMAYKPFPPISRVSTEEVHRLYDYAIRMKNIYSGCTIIPKGYETLNLGVDGRGNIDDRSQSDSDRPGTVEIPDEPGVIMHPYKGGLVPILFLGHLYPSDGEDTDDDDDHDDGYGPSDSKFPLDSETMHRLMAPVSEYSAAKVREYEEERRNKIIDSVMAWNDGGDDLGA